MTKRFRLEMDPASYEALQLHLLPRPPKAEEAAFAYAVVDQENPEEVSFRVVGIDLIPEDGFFHRSLYSLELSDETRARIIKRAHDLKASLVELHSHPFPLPAQFSASDHAGFLEVVPHVRWRLNGRPYLAIVVAPNSFDALVWAGNASTDPIPLTTWSVGSTEYHPTGLCRNGPRSTHA